MDEYRHWIRSGRLNASLVSINIPDKELNSLADTIFDNCTSPFTNPDTKEVGFTPLGLLGYSGVVERFTNKKLAARLVRATALLGSKAVVELIGNWVGGAPAHVIYTRVLRGIRLPKPIDLGDGATFELLPNNSRQLAKFIQNEGRVSPTDLINKPALRTVIDIDPVFYRPKATKHPYLLDDSMGWEGNVSGQEFAFDFDKYQRFLASLSLACNSYVRQTNTWHEIPLDLRFISDGYSLPTMVNVPRFEERPNPHAPPVPLTAESLDHAKTIYGQMEKSNTMYKLTKDWEESIYGPSARTRIERLRSVMALLYNPEGLRPDVGKIIARNASNHLAPQSRSDRDRCFNRFLMFYKLASKVAHGEKTPNAEEITELLPWAYETLRLGILNRLAETNWPAFVSDS